MFILCSGTLAKKPYVIELTNTRIYSLEELCYYLYQNVYSITEDLFDVNLIDWLRKETNNEKLADKLNDLVEKGSGLKDLIVTVLCGADYYNETEIRSLITLIDKVEQLPYYGKMKIKADNYLKFKKYGAAATEYQKLLYGSFAVNFTTKEYGDILHNLAIAHFYTGLFAESATEFKEAYVRNANPVSLKHYLYVLYIMGNEGQMYQEGINLGMDEEFVNECKRQCEAMIEKSHTSEEYLWLDEKAFVYNKDKLKKWILQNKEQYRERLGQYEAVFKK